MSNGPAQTTLEEPEILTGLLARLHCASPEQLLTLDALTLAITGVLDSASAVKLLQVQLELANIKTRSHTEAGMPQTPAAGPVSEDIRLYLFSAEEVESILSWHQRWDVRSYADLGRLQRSGALSKLDEERAAAIMGGPLGRRTRVADEAVRVGRDMPVAQVTKLISDEKLLKRMENAGREIQTVGDLFSLSAFDVLNLPGVGLSYVGYLTNLQRRALQELARPEEELEVSSPINRVDDTLAAELGCSQEVLAREVDPIPCAANERKALIVLRRDFHVTTYADVVDLVERHKSAKTYPGKLAGYEQTLHQLVDNWRDGGLRRHEEQLALFEPIHSVRLKHIPLATSEQSMLRILKKHKVRCETVKDLLLLPCVPLIHKTIGAQPIVDQIALLRTRLISDVQDVARREQQWRAADMSTRQGSYQRLDLDLRAAVDRMDLLSDRDDSDAVMTYLGICSDYLTLKVLGQRRGVSESRMSQKMKSILEKLRSNLRGSQEEYRGLVANEEQEDFVELLPLTYQLFQTTSGRAGLLRFLQIFLGLSPEQVSGNPLPDSKVDDHVEDFFAENSVPCNVQLLCDSFRSAFGATPRQCRLALNGAAERGLLELTADTVVGVRFMESGLAAAHILLDQPEGLRWEDIHRAVVGRGILRKEIAPESFRRQIASSPCVYLCAPGSFRHLDYFPLGEEEENQVIEWVHNLIRTADRELWNIQELVEASPIRTGYYELRLLLTESFPEHFEGESNRDVLRRSAEGECPSIRESLLDAIRTSDSPQSAKELSEFVRAPLETTRHLLAALVKERRVLPIDSSRYTSRERALDCVDAAELKKAIIEILGESDRIVEADVLREVGNQRLHYNFSREVYAAVARELVGEGKAFCARNLFSNDQIPYTSMTEIFEACYERGMDEEHFVEKLQERVRVSRWFVAGQLKWRLSEMTRRIE